MPTGNSKEYYAARAVVARQMATRAIDRHIAGIHAKMADQYEQLATLSRDELPKLRVVGG